MERSECEAIVALCVMAAFADGRMGAPERERIRVIVDQLGRDGLDQASQRAMLGQTTLEAEAARLKGAESRQLAFESALAVCGADGPADAEEHAFLDRLRAALALDDSASRALVSQADALAAGSPAATGSAPAAATGTAAAAAPEPAASAASSSGGAPPTSAVNEAELDRSILNYAILTGGLELLPQSLASMAIIPVQMKMVYEIGKRYGYTLDRGHVVDFLGTVGIGLTGQVFEGVARRLLRGFGRLAGGPLLGGLVGTAGGMAFSFGTTWAIGQVARSYYAAGRRLDGEALRELFQRKLAEGQSLYPRYRSEVESRSRGIDVSSLSNLVRGN